MSQKASLILAIFLSNLYCIAGEPSRTTVQLEEQIGAVPRAFVNLGNQIYGQDVTFQLRLLNPFDEPIAFDNVVSGCSCREISPKSGKIPAHGSADITLRLSMSNRLSAAADGGSLMLSMGTTPVAEIAMSYQFKDYVGLKNELVVIQAREKTDAVQLVVPLIRGTEISDSDFDLSSEGIIGKFSWDVVNDGGAILCKFTELKPDDSQTQYGTLLLTNLRSGQSSRAKVVVEFTKPVSIFPRVLHLARSAETDLLSTLFFCNVQADAMPGQPTQGDKGSVSRMIPASVTVTIDGKLFEAKRISTLSGLSKYRLELPADFQSLKDGERTTAKVTCVINSESYESDVHIDLEKK